MKTNVKSSLLALFAVSLITLGTYMVQAEEVGVLPPEPIIEVVETIPPAPGFIETETEILPTETLTDLGSSTLDASLDIEVTESTVTTDTEIPPVVIINEEIVLDPETSEVPVLEKVFEDTPLLNDRQPPDSLEETRNDSLPIIIQDCVGGGFRHFSRPFAHPGECLDYVRSL